MKHVLIILLMFGAVNMSWAQDPEELKEATVEYIRTDMKMDPYTQSVALTIPEDRYGEFKSAPLTFIKNRFSPYQLVSENKDQNFDSYEVYFNIKNGYVVAKYDEEGDLLSTFQRFNDIQLPEKAKEQIMKKMGKDTQILGAKMTAVSDGWDISKEIYRVDVKANGRTQKVKLVKKGNNYSM